jgi:aminoglycoside 2'-N-acetyltransferase I
MGPGPALRETDRVRGVRLLTTAEASDDLLTEIRGLLAAAFDGGFSDEDWEHTLGGWHVVVDNDGVTVSHAAVVSRSLDVADRSLRVGYVEGVATAPSRQREGFGTLALTELSKVVRRDFEMGALSSDRHGFYERLGWERWRGPTFVRRGSRSIRTEDEDDGIMVLRFGPSADVDLSARLTCEGRDGDDW